MDESVYSHRRIDPAKLAALNRRSDARGLLQLGGHAAALAASGLLLNRTLGSWLAVPATVLHGAVLIFLFAPLHESIHRTAFRSRRLNDVVARVLGFLLLLPADYFRAFHFAHHRHTQDPAKDPELALAKPATWGQWLIHASGWRYWRGQTVGLVQHALGRTPEPFLARDARRIVAEARLTLAGYAFIAVVALAAGSWAPLVYWVGPALAGQPFLRLYLLAEHTGCPLVADMLANSRTTLTNAAVRFFAWNMPYHAEHHAFPSVPFHALPRLHRELREDLRVVGRGYLAVQRGIMQHLR
jgi:fatty acid desaturase